MNAAVTVMRLAGLALAAVAVDWILYQASHDGGAAARLTFATLRAFLPLLAPTIVLVRWKYSLLTIVVALYGFVAIETLVTGVAEYGWGWLSFVDVALWTLMRGSIAIWPIFVPLVLFLRRNRGGQPPLGASS